MLREALARRAWRRQTCPTDEAFMRDWKARDHRRQYDVVWIDSEHRLYVQVWSVSAIGGHQFHQYVSVKAAVQDLTLREIYEVQADANLRILSVEPTMIDAPSMANDLRSVLDELGYPHFVHNGRVAIVVNRGKEFQSAIEIATEMCAAYGPEVLEDLEDVTVEGDRVIFDNYEVNE